MPLRARMEPATLPAGPAPMMMTSDFMTPCLEGDPDTEQESWISNFCSEVEVARNRHQRSDGAAHVDGARVDGVENHVVAAAELAVRREAFAEVKGPPHFDHRRDEVVRRRRAADEAVRPQLE